MTLAGPRHLALRPGSPEKLERDQEQIAHGAPSELLVFEFVAALAGLAVVLQECQHLPDQQPPRGT